WPFATVGAGTVALALVARRRAARDAIVAADTTPAHAAALEVALSPQLLQQLGASLADRLRDSARAVGDDLGLPLPGLEVRADARRRRGAARPRRDPAPARRAAVAPPRAGAGAGAAQDRSGAPGRAVAPPGRGRRSARRPARRARSRGARSVDRRPLGARRAR